MAKTPLIDPDSREKQDARFDPAQQYYDREFNDRMASGVDKAKTDQDAPHDSLGSDLAEQEDSVKAPSSATTESSSGVIPYTPGKVSDNIRQRLTGKQRSLVAGGIFGSLLTLYLTFSSLAPLQAVHWSKILQDTHFSASEKFGDEVSARYLFFLAAGATEQGRLGYVANKYADKWEARLNEDSGLKSVYADNRGRRLVGYEVLDKDKAKPFLDELRQDNIPITNNGAYVDLSDEKFATRRSVTKVATRSLHMGKLNTVITSRMLIKRAGVDFHPMKNVVRKKTDDYLEYRDKIRKQRAEANAMGVQDPNLKAAQADNPDNDGDGKPDGSPADAAEASSEAQAILDQASAIDTNTPEGQEAYKGLIDNIATKLSLPTAAVGILCTVKSMGNLAEDIEYDNNIKPLMRIGMGVVTTGEQQAAGHDFNADELGVHVDDFYDPETGTSFGDARSIQAAQGVNGGPDIPSEAKPSAIGEKNRFFTLVDNIPALGGVCTAVDAVGGLPIIKQIGELGSVIIDEMLGVFGTSATEIARGIAGIFANNVINMSPRGALYGSYADYGTRLAANDQAIATGGRELTKDEEAQLAREAAETRQTELANMGIIERYFSPDNTYSLTTALALKAPVNTQQAVGGLTKIPSFLAASLLNIPQAGAAETVEYDYGFNKFGFSIAERNNPAIRNPFENARIVRPELERYNSEYGEPCFGVQIVPGSGPGGESLQYGEKNYKEIDREKCTDDNLEYLRYRYYIADFLNATAMGCYEGDKALCDELGFNGPIGSGDQQNTAPISGEGLTCPANMTQTIQVSGSTYYKMPDAPNGEYHIYSVDRRRYGQKELVCVLYTASMAYRQAYGEKSKVWIGDLNAAGHKSHKWGIAVDLRAQGEVGAADRQDSPQTYSPQATIDLGKALINTGLVKNIWWCERGAAPGDTSGSDGTMTAMRDYAESIGKPITIRCITKHEDHFHLDINMPKGATHTP